MTKDTERYSACMDEIKLRADLIHKIIQSRVSLGSELFDGEIICLQIRKILELIALSSLVANKEKYAAAYEKFQFHWKANKILEALGKINPDFYPTPVKISQKGKVGENNFWHLEHIKDGYLTKDEFIKLLDICSDALHIWNPYNPRKRIINFELSVDEWMKKIECLLQIHSMHLADSKDYWLVVMGKLQEKVHTYTLGHMDISSAPLEAQALMQIPESCEK